MLDLANRICEDISAKHVIGHDCEEAAYPNSAVSHISLLLLEYIKKICLLLNPFFNLLRPHLERRLSKKQLGYIGGEALCRCNQVTMVSRKNGQNLRLISPLSENLSRLLFDEEVSLTDKSNGQVPKAGDIVKLVGRKPFPCVCDYRNKQSI